MTLSRLLFGLILVCPLSGGEWFPVRIEGAVYPSLANQARIQGVVKLKLTLSTGGEVLTAEVESGNSVLAKEAQANALLWRFAVGCPNEQPVPKTIEVMYDYRLNGEVLERPTSRFRYEHPYRISVVSQALHWMPEGGESGSGDLKSGKPAK